MEWLKDEKRSVVLDILKLIGLVCIVFAHANPPAGWFQLRNFDVPLMVIVSVWLSLRSLNRPDFQYKLYMKKRFKRLVYPTWVFLTVFFLVQGLFFGKVYDGLTILSSFLLIKGIGYVWVIRIYLTVALLLPLLGKTQKWQHTKVLIVGVIWSLVYHQLAVAIQGVTGDVRVISEAFFFDPLGYGFIAYIAIWVSRLSRKQLVGVAGLFGLFYLGMGWQNGFLPTQKFKYPVQMYYLAYSFMMSFGLCAMFVRFKEWNLLKPNRVVQWLSEQSMWLYLWHVLTLLSFRLIPRYQALSYGWKFIVLVLSTLILTIGYQLIKNQLKLHLKTASK